MKKICAILLAAGKSTRMDEPKPLLKWMGTTLLEYQINQLARLSFAEIITVLGSKANVILQTISIEQPKVRFLECKKYEAGLSASLKYSLEYAQPKYDGVILQLVDMPFIQFETMKQVFATGAKFLENTNEPFVVQPSYKNQAGHPVFIGNFQSLNWSELQGDIGAKPLIKQMNLRYLIPTNDFGVVFDIDTPEVYQEALNLSQSLRT